MIMTLAAVTALALGSGFAAVAFTFGRLQRAQLDTELLAVARDEAREAPGNGLSFSSRPGPAASDIGAMSEYGVIFDETGAVITATAPFDRIPPPARARTASSGTFFDFKAGDAHLRGVVVDIPGHAGKRMLIAASQDDLDGDEAFLFRAMVLAFALAVLSSAMIGGWRANVLTADHAAIASVVRRVAAGDLSARLAISTKDVQMAQLARDVNDMVTQINTLVGAQSRFLAHAAHELRSPLTKLYGELQQALRKPRDAEGYRRGIAEALEATRRLNHLADDLLALARAKPVGVEGAAVDERVAVASIVESAVELVQEEARARNVRIDVIGGNEAVRGRASDLARMVRNLVENAVEHSPSDSHVSVKWQIRARSGATPRDGEQGINADGDALEISVRDAGDGVPEAERDKIFEPFFRGPRPRKTHRPGTGLGLGIAREIARAHGGDLVVDAPSEGDPRRGATFRATIAKLAGS